VLKAALEASSELRDARDQLMKIRATMGQQDFRFNPFFATRVMARIEQLKAPAESLVESLEAAFLRVSLPAFAMVLALLAFIFFSETSLSVEALTGTESVEFSDVFDYAIASNY
ncbi:MAG: hypothetical protein AAFV07_13795, partial [Bacteroidota bacterium]